VGVSVSANREIRRKTAPTPGTMPIKFTVQPKEGLGAEGEGTLHKGKEVEGSLKNGPRDKILRRAGLLWIDGGLKTVQWTRATAQKFSVWAEVFFLVW